MRDLPEGWQQKKLNKCLDKIIDYRGKTVEKSSYGIPLITARNVRKGYLDFSQEEFVTEDIYDKWMLRGFPKSGDVLFTTEAPLGMAAMYPGGVFALNQRIVTLRTDNKLLDGLYLMYYLLSSRGQNEVYVRSSGSTATGIKQSELRKINVLIPPLAEQKKIAAILSTWDEAIALTEALIEALQRRKKALMQRLLTGEVRFPGFDGGWELVRLQDVSKINNSSISSNTAPDEEFYYIELSAVSEGKIDFPSTKSIFGELSSRARRIPKAGDIIMSTVRPNLLGYAIYDFEDEDVLCSTGFAVITPDRSSDTNWIYYNLYGDTIQRQIDALVTGSNYPAINSTEASNLRFLFPDSVEEREKVGQVFQSCDDEIERLHDYRWLLQEQKKGLMQQLLTGRIRVAVE